MDFERASLLLNIIHMSIGVDQAKPIAAAATRELFEIANPPAKAIPAGPELDLSGKPVEEEEPAE